LSIQPRATDTDHCGEKALQNPTPSGRIRGDIIFHQAQKFRRERSESKGLDERLT
jgi:hypothetical protein